MNDRAIRVLLVDDEELVRAGLRAILDAERDIAVLGEASDGSEVAGLVRRLEPDVVLMDISMPVLDGFDATRKIREAHPKTCVLFLTGSDAPSDVAEAQRVGASGYVTKDRIATELVDAIFEAAPPCTPLS